MRIFSPKHQKLVNQCYPSGRTPDKKPKSSETSYLLYYVNSRRSKLEKVSTYLVKRTNIDLSHRRVGNVGVTLDIMHDIVEHCKENLNVFVKDFLNIMIKILTNNNFNNDVSIIELAEHTFASVCRNVDGAMSGGDAEFIKLYSSFEKLYFDVARDILDNDDLLLKGCIDISYTTDLASNPQINHFIPRSVTYALEKFIERYPRYSALDLGTPTDQNITKSLSKVQTRTAGLDDIYNANADLSVKTLQAYFTTTETNKLTLAIRALLDFLQRSPNKDLLQFICNGIPVQLRYIVVVLLIRHLTDSGNKADPIISLRLISSLLGSDVSIVGLSIMDMMRKILKFQLDNVADAKVVDQCRKTIADLNNKIYYRGQIADMLFELELKLQSTNNESERAILISDVDELLTHMSTPCVGLELFLNLAPFMDSNGKLKLFDAVDDRFSGGNLLLQLFEMINGMSNSEDQKILMHLVFQKYKNLALLSGLNYFTENVTEPTRAYYLYHGEAATFLKMNNYGAQVDLRNGNQTLFNRDELLGFYSDERINKYSKKGTQILVSNPHNLSTSDLFSDHYPQRTNTFSEMNGNRDSTIGTFSGNNSTRASITRSLNGNGPADLHSWRGLKSSAPRVNDLKRAISSPRKTIAARSNTMRGSQSVKSKVTNITFLLNELRNNDDGNTSHIMEPDEDQPLVLDKNDIARSSSMRSTPPLAHPDYSETNLSNTEQDKFQDAQEEVNLTNQTDKLVV
ncbi:hypothetical protein ZYGR_0AS04070 [Zygosaccharomyces rouxii]|uniref:Protein EFR3 n=1 Tax=Zygosaccharomyces rouxii TaxID=4956 RepID=A0A1Q3AH63_ZYGRO|nr:hypothetical protein ZYGR_0AS04070 [Zygosaccharomyces rouxii]